MSWFADTSFFVAYLTPRELVHDLALHYMLDTAEPIITTQWVLAELANFLASKNRVVLSDLLLDIAGSFRFTIVPADNKSFNKALKLYNRRRDKQWSFTDCASFQWMDQHNIREALTTDHHFEQAGFTILLR